VLTGRVSYSRGEGMKHEIEVMLKKVMIRIK